jgi:hypothetical protein
MDYTEEGNFRQPDSVVDNAQESINLNAEDIDEGCGYVTMIIQTGHGGNGGDIYTNDGSGKAIKADSTDKTKCRNCFMLNADTAEDQRGYFKKVGWHKKTGWGLTANSTYWLDPATPGAITITKPATGFLVKIGFTKESETDKISLDIVSHSDVGVAITGGIYDALVAVSGGDYATIAAACTAEEPGAVIGVVPGEYDESGADIAPKEGQSIEGAGGLDDNSAAAPTELPSVVAKMGDSILDLDNDRVKIKGIYFQFTGTTDEDKIDIDASDCDISECTFDFTPGAAAHDGIDIANGESGIQLRNIRIKNDSLSRRAIWNRGDNCLFDNIIITGGTCAASSLVNQTDGVYNSWNKITIKDLDAGSSSYYLFSINSGAATGGENCNDFFLDVNGTATKSLYVSTKISALLSNIHVVDGLAEADGTDPVKITGSYFGDGFTVLASADDFTLMNSQVIGNLNLVSGSVSRIIGNTIEGGIFGTTGVCEIIGNKIDGAGSAIGDLNVGEGTIITGNYWFFEYNNNIQASRNNVIKDNYFFFNSSYTLTVGFDLLTFSNTTGIFEGNYVLLSSSLNMHVIRAAGHWNIVNNVIRKSSAVVGTYSAIKITSEGCHVSENSISWIPSSTGSQIQIGGDNCVVSNNYMEDLDDGIGIEVLAGSDGCSIVGNVADMNAGSPTVIKNDGDICTITGNAITFGACTSPTCIDNNGTNCTITGNTIQWGASTAPKGIDNDGDYSVITSNNIDTDGNGTGIVDTSTGSDFANNMVDTAVIGQVIHTPTAIQNITAAGGTSLETIIRVQGNGGAIDITANPQIAAHVDGKFIIVEGSSDANTVKLDDGTGLELAGGVSFTMGKLDVIAFTYNTTESLWVEQYRSDN